MFEQLSVPLKRIPVRPSTQAVDGYTFGPTYSKLDAMTSVADLGQVQIPSTPVAIKPMRHRNFRLDDETWDAASRIAELRNERISDVMRTLVRGYVRRHKRLLDSDPEWQSRKSPTDDDA